MRRIWGLFCALCVLFVGLCALANGEEPMVILPEYPPEVPRSQSCRVTVQGRDIPVMDVTVNHRRVWTSRPMTAQTPMASFQTDGSVDVEVTFPGVALESVTVRPLAGGVNADLAGDKARFTLPGPGYYTVEYNQQVEGALMLFADPVDRAIPSPADENTIYLAPGVHELRTITLRSNQTLYLAPGAVLHGQVVADGVENIRVCGRGVIDQRDFSRWDDTLLPIFIQNSKNVRIEGIHIVNPSAWVLNTYKCEDVLVENVKIIGACSNSDGVSTQSCTRQTVRDCFIRGWDDNLVVKGHDGNVRDILFERCILWTDLAQSCEIGYETRAELIENITFRDITVLHAFHKPVLSIHNSDNALVRNVRYERILVEDCQLGQGDGANFLIDLTTTKSQWSQADRRGNIRDIHFDGVTVLSGKEPSIRIFPYSQDFTIDQVTFRGITILGKPIHGFEDVKYNTNRKVGPDIQWLP